MSIVSIDLPAFLNQNPPVIPDVPSFNALTTDNTYGMDYTDGLYIGEDGNIYTQTTRPASSLENTEFVCSPVVVIPDDGESFTVIGIGTDDYEIIELAPGIHVIAVWNAPNDIRKRVQFSKNVTEEFKKGKFDNIDAIRASLVYAFINSSNEKYPSSPHVVILARDADGKVLAGVSYTNIPGISSEIKIYDQMLGIDFLSELIELSQQEGVTITFTVGFWLSDNQELTVDHFIAGSLSACTRVPDTNTRYAFLPLLLSGDTTGFSRDPRILLSMNNLSDMLSDAVNNPYSDENKRLNVQKSYKP